MEYKTIKNYENYNLYENGDVFNNKTNQKLTINNSNNQSTIKLCKNSKSNTFTLGRLIYETFYNEKLTNKDIIKFKNENSDNKFHYKNLEKINKTDMFKNINHIILDTNKEWKNIKNYDDYKISNYGDIFSIKSNKMLKPIKDNENYYCVKLILNNKRNSFLVHRLVYDTFKNLINGINMVVDHIDRNPSNNHIDNLREVSKSQNSYNRESQKINTNKIQQFTLNNEFVKEWNSITEICKELKYSISHISNNYLGKNKNAYGFIWKNLSIVNDLTCFKPIIVDDGKTYSNYKINNKGEIINRNNILMNYNINKGYQMLELKADDNTYKTLKVNRLVALTFLENPNNYEIVNHIDENKLNNNVENLQWCNHKQNISHSQGKKVNQINIETNEIIKTFDTINDAFRELNKNYGANIRLVCECKRKSAFGYKWSFMN
jgi:hypothetical protein